MTPTDDPEDTIDFSDLMAEDLHQPSRWGGGKRKPIMIITTVALILIMLAVGVYVVFTRYLPLPLEQASLATETVVATETAEATNKTVVAPAAAGKHTPTPTQTSEPTEETPPDTAPVRLAPPPSAALAAKRDNASSDNFADLEARAVKYATDMAISEPFHWEFYEFESAVLPNEIRKYYVDLLNRDMGFSMTFDQQFSGAMYIYKFKQDGHRVTIQFWGAVEGRVPVAFIYYEGWQ